MNDAKHTPHLLDICLAGVGGALIALIGWFAFHTTNLPSFGTSNVMRALATGAVVLVVVASVVLVVWGRGLGRPKWVRFGALVFAYLAPALIVLATLAIPLSGTKLYLGGLNVDQEFRTQYLTRLADSPELSDMNYFGLPAFYPAGWFWLGGRFASLLGMAGWEAFQPWAIVSMAAAASILVPVWRKISGSLAVGVTIAVISTIIVLIMNAEEPYAAIVAMGVPAAAVLAGRGMRGSRWALIGLTVYLGISASMYTLYTVIIAGSVVIIALGYAIKQRSVKPVGRVAVVGVCSMLMASSVWLPYLLDISLEDRGAAAHYLPEAGTTVPLPMFSPSVLGVLCLLGVLCVVVCWRVPDVRALGVVLVASYGWVVLSMLVTLLGTTLLGFRVDVLVALVLATLGVVGLVRVHELGVEKLVRFVPASAVTAGVVAVLSLGVVAYAQQVPVRNYEAIDLAYSTTDGSGERADRFPPNSAKWYPEVDQVLREVPKERRDTIVLTDEFAFLAYYPYRGFQAFTAHYANPLGQFERRNALIEQWANDSWGSLADPGAFADEVAAAPWAAPDAFVFQAGQVDEDQAQQRGGSEASEQDGWVFDLAEDIYPNSPNVRFRGVAFNPEVFSDEFWRVERIGPYVVVLKK
ncbi:arabinofuranosyltransferase [Corynebacterium pelargi]|uniref:Galactan 5-O-arabinofuranosyltransferase n=1 Tax=Corynebacterium pelargi TaxID=1471400 RepID=A0A410W5X2_9CORY|nr:arabinofuranosyltransferase [Corynebacterium pelargi]QAU51428.1 Arabinofuranosyltransferase AftA [Corynebacterium pelargi]